MGEEEAGRLFCCLNISRKWRVELSPDITLAASLSTAR